MSRPGPDGPDGTVPWPPGRVTEEPLDEVDVDRLMVFVPAIMSVGLAFSIATLVRDLFHWTGNRARERRTAIEAGAVVSSSLLGVPVRWVKPCRQYRASPLTCQPRHIVNRVVAHSRLTA